MNGIMISPEIKERIDSLDYEDLLDLRNEYINSVYTFNDETKKIAYDQIEYTKIINVVKYIDTVLDKFEEFQMFKSLISIDLYNDKIASDLLDEDRAIYNLNVDILYFKTLMDNFPNDYSLIQRVGDLVEYMTQLIEGINIGMKILEAEQQSA